MRILLSTAAAALALALTASPEALASCSYKTDNVNGKLGGDPFAFPTDTRAFGFGDDNNYARLQSEDCDTNSFKEAKRDARRSAATAAALDVYGLEPGLNVTVNYTNSGLEDDTNAAGLNLSWKQDIGPDAWVESFTFSAGFASDTTWDEQMVKVGGNLAIGQLF